jgi:RHS repeat-associated protein
MYFFLTDQLGSVRDLIDDQGNVQASYEFSEYGERISTFENGVSSQKTIVGGMFVQDEVADTGLMLMGHRFYDPGLGRFLNRDPIGFAGGLNLFSYGGNNPVTFTAHTGLSPDWTAGVQSGRTSATAHFMRSMLTSWNGPSHPSNR